MTPSCSLFSVQAMLLVPLAISALFLSIVCFQLGAGAAGVRGGAPGKGVCSDGGESHAGERRGPGEGEAGFRGCEPSPGGHR